MAEQLRRGVPGGIGTYARGLLGGLHQLAAPDVEVIVHASRARRTPDPLSSLGHRVDASPLPGILLTRLWDRGLARPPAGDVMHATSFAVPPSVAPRVIAVHDLAWRVVPEAFPPRGRRWHERALRRAIASDASLVVPSSETGSALASAGVDGSRITVIEEGCDHLPPPDSSGADALLERLGVVNHFILTVATLEPRKNLRRVVEAHALARPLLPEPWPLIVVGPTGWGDGSPLAGATGVKLAGEVSAAVLAALYARARCLVYAPLVEGFGLPPVEAMHACTPVVASPMPSTKGSGLEVDPTDVSAIADAIVRAAGDDRIRAELVTAGLLRASELTWRRAAEAHVALWREVAQ
ncbi:MAG TPA: glycosyltransferase family 1 protein [Acidimicrobiales bacterium]|nr:glycosyltransferase family 1 protein [Acidimicrobiales bacterium]